jgi:hypothetical protein
MSLPAKAFSPGASWAIDRIFNHPVNREFSIFFHMSAISSLIVAMKCTSFG